MSIKLEVGKFYELNNGEVHECTRMRGDDPLAVDNLGYGPFVIGGMAYHQDGTFAGRTSIQEYHGVKRCVDDVRPDETDGAPQLWRDMTPEEKGALLLAHHEGKAIEEFEDDAKYWEISAPPEWIDSVAYRIKPDPVCETVTLYGAPEKHIEWRVEQCGLDTHRITFNVIDGVPDCASVKMEKL